MKRLKQKLIKLFLSSKEGSALIQVFIMSGLLSVLGLVLTRQQETQRGSALKVSSTFEFDNLRWDIEQILLSDDACNSTFGSLPGFDFATLVGSSSTISQIKGKDDSVLYEVGSDKYASDFFKINSMRLENATYASGTGNNVGNFDLNIEFEITKKGVLGGTIKNAVIPITVELSGGNIAKCFSEELNQVQTSKDETCAKVGGVYSPSAGLCQLQSYDDVNGITASSTGAVSNAYFYEWLTSPTTGLDLEYINSSGDTIAASSTFAQLDINGGALWSNTTLLSLHYGFCIGGTCQTFRLEDCNGEEYLYQINGDGTINCRADKSAYGSGCTSLGFFRGYNTSGSPQGCSYGSAYTPTPTPTPTATPSPIPTPSPVGTGGGGGPTPTPTPVCPDGFVEVPGNYGLGTYDFCVMQFEAKNDGSGNATSTAANAPWVNISQSDSWTKCAAMSISGYNGEFALISNAEWMTIARNVENVASNWSGGSVGTGCLFKGNSGINDTCGYDGLDPEYGTGRNSKAKLTLNNGSEVWDLAGNVWEAVDWSADDSVYTAGPTTCSAGWTELASVSCGALSNSDYMPDNGSFNSSDGIGRFYGGTGGGTTRGRHSSAGSVENTGLFSLNFNDPPSNITFANGFRCVYRPKRTCPPGYIEVPGNSALGTEDFCVMQLEARNVSGVPNSEVWTVTDINLIWNNVTAPAAQAACESTSVSGYTGDFTLISNPEWMTIARNIESVSSNWSGGSVGSGMLARGHSDSNPAGIVDHDYWPDPYGETGNNSGQAAGSGWEQRRTHYLSNGEILWDFAGNLTEFVDWDPSDSGFTTGPTDASCTAREITSLVGSLVSTDLQSNGGYDSSKGTGRWYGGSCTGGSGYTNRGGFYSQGTYVGIYTASFDWTSSTNQTTGGFRCVYRPPVPNVCTDAGGFWYDNYCYFSSVTSGNCNTKCTSVGGTCDIAGMDHISKDQTTNTTKCNAVAGGLSWSDTTATNNNSGAYPYGCAMWSGTTLYNFYYGPSCSSALSGGQMACACNIPGMPTPTPTPTPSPTPSCTDLGGYAYDGFCWYYANNNTSACGSWCLSNSKGSNQWYAYQAIGNNQSNITKCKAVADGLGISYGSYSVNSTDKELGGYGCAINNSTGYLHNYNRNATSNRGQDWNYKIKGICACGPYTGATPTPTPTPSSPVACELSYGGYCYFLDSGWACPDLCSAKGRTFSQAGMDYSVSTKARCDYLLNTLSGSSITTTYSEASNTSMASLCFYNTYYSWYGRWSGVSSSVSNNNEYSVCSCN